jgi:hypothetical protein
MAKGDKYAGRVIDGVMVCGCSPAPVACCLFPWPDPDGTPLYPDTDLPSSLNVSIDNGASWINLTQTSPYYFEDGTGQYAIDGVTLEAWRFTFFDGVNTSEGRSDCLIGSYLDFGVVPAVMLVEDELLDNYSATYGAYDPITLTRQNTCEWTGTGVGTEGQEYTIRMYYDSTIYKWRIVIEIEATTFDPIKVDPQNVPTGDYDGLVTVS